jgi:uncharacterized membrane protein
MDLSLVIARLLHVVLGVFWAGTIVFNALFLVPAIGDAGPDGAKVGAALMRRRFLDILPATAVITILSGLWLYWRASSGFDSAYMRSGPGMTYGAGAVTAFAGFGVGMGVMRRSMLRAAQLSQSVSAAAPAERDALLATAQALRMRAARAGRVVAALLAFTAAAMAIGRYV